MEKKVTEFFEQEYIQWALNEVYQKISSVIDGMTPSQRKVFHTIVDNNMTSLNKVETIANRTANETEYLGGANNLIGVTVNMTKNYVGSNNYSFFDKKGNFGNRFLNEASAGRYIYVKKGSLIDSLFSKDDNDILHTQYFEGQRIEPRYFLPIIPTILLNGALGVSVGHAQKILPRNPDELKKYIRMKLSGKNSNLELKPWFKGFQGTVEQGDEPKKWLLKGVAKILNTTTIEITELPPSYTLSKYLKILDTLEEKKIITSYEDKSDSKTDKYHFIVKVQRAWLKDKTEEDILSHFKLIERLSENFTCMSENNSIVIFNDVFELVEYWIEFRIKWYATRKENLLEKLKSKIDLTKLKKYFIQFVVDGKIKVFKQSKKSIIEQINEHFKEDVDVDKLLSIPVHAFTLEKIQSLQDEYDKLLDEEKRIDATTVEDFWIEDLKKLNLKD